MSNGSDDQGRRRWLDSLVQHPDFGVFAYEPLPRLWSLDFPAGLSEHLVYLVVSGYAEGTAASARVRLAPGSLMWLGPRVPFALREAGGGERISVYRFRLRPLPGEHAPRDQVLVLPDAWELRATFDALIAELSTDVAFRERRIPALLTLLFTGIFRLSDGQRGVGRPLDLAQRRMLETYVDRRITGRMQPAELAELLALSPDYFTRRFRQTFGVSPKVWLVQRRVRQAALHLDESSDSIAEVAAVFGYSDVFLFSRQFKSVMGVSPRAYRAR